MLQLVIDSDQVLLRVNRQTIHGQVDDIGQEASESPTMKVKCRGVQVDQEGRTEKIAAIDLATENRVLSVVAPETTTATRNMAKRLLLSIPVSNGWKFNESKQKFPIWEQFSKRQS